MKIFLHSLAVFLLLSSTPFAAQATTMRLASFEELVALSDSIIVGNAVASEAEWIGYRIYTRHYVSVEQVWHGSAVVGQHLEVLTLGGRVGDVAQHVAGAAQLKKNQRSIFFLGQGSITGAATLHPVGMWQGVFHIDPTEDGPALSRNGGTVELLGPDNVLIPDRLEIMRVFVEGLLDAP